MIATTVLTLGAALIVALPGLCARRNGPWTLRLATLLVLAAIGAVALDWPRQEGVREQRTLTLVVPGGVDTATRAALTAQLGGSPWRVVETAPRAAEVGAALALVASDDQSAPALLWTEPLHDGGAPSARPAPVFTARAPLPFELQELSARAVNAPVQGRPLAVELDLPDGLRGEGTVRLSASEGSEVAVRPMAAGMPPGAGANPRLDVPAPAAGEHRLAVDVRVGDVAVTATGGLTVAPGGRVVAVGALAPSLARALTVQGYRVEVATEVPASLADVDVLVAAAPVPATDAARVRAFVLDGGGLFFVGAPDGGGVPIDADDLASLSPVTLAARPTPASPDGVGAGRPTDTPPSPPTGPPPTRPPEQATGETDVTPPPTPPAPKEIERRSVAVVLVVDRSASMAELVAGDGGLRRTRMDYVRSSAEATIRRLWPGDLLAIVSFGNKSAHEVVLPLTGADDLGGAYRALAQLQARHNEGTYLESALAHAGAILAPVRAPVKHVVVITDGVIVDLRPESTVQAQELRKAGITVSLIRFGAETAETMHFAVDCRLFARLGGGQYVFSTRTTEVPALVSEEVRRVFVASGRPDANGTEPPTEGAPAPGPGSPPPIQEPPRPADPPAESPPAASAALAVRVLGPSPLLEPLPENGLPAVGGVLAVAARPESQTLLVAGTSGHPLLAFSNRGLGRVGVFTSGLDRAWGSAWLDAPQFPSWFARWVAAVAPPRATPAHDLLTEKVAAPRGPTPGELRALATFSGQAVLPLAAIAPEQVRVVARWRGTALALAIAAGAAIVALAMLEFILVRRR